MRAAANFDRFSKGCLVASLAGVLFTGVSMQAAHAAETKNFVVSWFHAATNSEDGDCSKGLNPNVPEYYTEAMKVLGHSPEVAAEMVKKGYLGATDATPEFRGIIQMRGRLNGQPVNVYENPATVPDSRLHEVDGKYAYGFNLDGKGAASPLSYEDPETHEKGVNNNYNRAIGCTLTQRAKLPDRPSYQAYVWDNLRENMPAWIFSVTGENLSKDGPVTITFDRSLDHLTRDALGNIMHDLTLRIDPSTRTHHVMRGEIKSGVLTITEPGDYYMLGDISFYSALDMKKTHMRLKLNQDGTAEGFIGGYTSWQELYWMFGNGGQVVEMCCGVDMPGLYHQLKRLADADPDPATGQNTRISATFRIEAVPALLVPAAAQTAEAR
jgi:hypothetical protein